MREDIKRNALLAKRKPAPTVSVEIVGLEAAQELLAQSEEKPDEAKKDEEREQELEKLKMLK